MNKKILLSIGAIILAGGVWYVLQQSQNTAPEGQPEQLTTQQEGDIAITGETTEVWYSAQKKFFSRPTETIEGRNTTITGFARTASEGEVSGEVIIAHDGFVSSSSQRDADVAKLLGGPIKATFENIQMNEFINTESEVVVPIEVTINGVTKEVSFFVTSTSADTQRILQGRGELLIEDFNLKPPSLLNVYEVDNVLGIGFRTQITIE